MYHSFLIASLAIALSVSCSNRNNAEEEQIRSAQISQVNEDTVWCVDKSEYDVGVLVNGKQIGKWIHNYKNDTGRYEERFYVDDKQFIKCRYFRSGTLYLEENFLSNGIFSISYYPNGCINSFGYHRTVNGIQGEQDGLWITYDSTGNLFSETTYDYSHNKILYKEYESSQHFLVKECQYFQESGEVTLFKNGAWKYYKNGKLEKTEKHKMESTLEKFGE